MTTPITSHRRARYGTLAVGASLALGLVASVGLQLAGDAPKPAIVAVTADCNATGAAFTAL